MHTTNKKLLKEGKKDARRLAAAVIAAFIMALNINTFVNTGGLYPGGVTGLAVLVQRVFQQFGGVEIPYTVINLALNAIPVYIGFRYVGKRFTFFSFVMIIVNSILVDVLPAHVITYDLLLISIFGGLINGAAISICLLADTSSGGTDFISIFLSQRSGMDSFNIILGFNIVILVAAGFLFGWDKALYSIIFQFASTQVIHLLYRNYQQVTLFIVTEKVEAVCQVIYQVSGHGATVLPGEGSHEQMPRPVVYSVVDTPDSRKVIAAVRKVDPKAFVNCIQTRELRGNFYYSPKD